MLDSLFTMLFMILPILFMVLTVVIQLKIFAVVGGSFSILAGVYLIANYTDIFISGFAIMYILLGVYWFLIADRFD